MPPHHHHKNLGHSRGFPQRQGWTHRIGPSVPVPFNHKDKYPHARHHGNAKNKGLKPVLRVQPTCQNLKMRPLFYCLAYTIQLQQLSLLLGPFSSGKSLTKYSYCDIHYTAICNSCRSSSQMLLETAQSKCCQLFSSCFKAVTSC